MAEGSVTLPKSLRLKLAKPGNGPLHKQVIIGKGLGTIGHILLQGQLY